MCTLPRSVNILYSFIHTHTHPWNPSNETDSLIRIMVNNGRFLSLGFIIKAVSQGESQGDTREVERNDGKNGKIQILDTLWGLRAVPDYCHDNAREETMFLALELITDLSCSNLGDLLNFNGDNGVAEFRKGREMHVFGSNLDVIIKQVSIINVQ